MLFDFSALANSTRPLHLNMLEAIGHLSPEHPTGKEAIALGRTVCHNINSTDPRLSQLARTIAQSGLTAFHQKRLDTLYMSVIDLINFDNKAGANLILEQLQETYPTRELLALTEGKKLLPLAAHHITSRLLDAWIAEKPEEKTAREDLKKQLTTWIVEGGHRCQLILVDIQVSTLPPNLFHHPIFINLTTFLYEHPNTPTTILTEFPDVSPLKELEYLYIQKQRLSDIPGLAVLENLEELHLPENPLHVIPASFFDLKTIRKITLDLYETESTTEEEIEKQAVVILKWLYDDDVILSEWNLGDQCPQLKAFYGINPETNWTEGLSAYIDLFGKTSCFFSQPLYWHALELKLAYPWLESLDAKMRYYISEASREEVKSLVTSLLTLATSNKRFRAKFIAIAEESQEVPTCIDGMTLSLVHMYEASRSLKIDFSSSLQVLSIARELAIHEKIFNLSVEHIRTLKALEDAAISGGKEPSTDQKWYGNHIHIQRVEREILLAFLLEMKEALQLTIPLQTVTRIFGGITPVTDLNIAEALSKTLTFLQDKAAYHKALLKRDAWALCVKLYLSAEYEISSPTELSKRLEEGLDVNPIPAQFIPILQKILELGISTRNEVILSLLPGDPATQAALIARYNAQESEEDYHLSALPGKGKKIVYPNLTRLSSIVKAHLLTPLQITYPEEYKAILTSSLSLDEKNAHISALQARVIPGTIGCDSEELHRNFEKLLTEASSAKEAIALFGDTMPDIDYQEGSSWDLRERLSLLSKLKEAYMSPSAPTPHQLTRLLNGAHQKNKTEIVRVLKTLQLISSETPFDPTDYNGIITAAAHMMATSILPETWIHAEPAELETRLYVKESLIEFLKNPTRTSFSLKYHCPENRSLRRDPADDPLSNFPKDFFSHPIFQTVTTLESALGIDDNMTIVLPNLSPLMNLETLTLKDFDLSSIPGLSTLSKLHSLELIGIPLTPSMKEEISSLKLKNLTINISKKKIDFSWLRSLCEINPALQLTLNSSIFYTTLIKLNHTDFIALQLTYPKELSLLLCDETTDQTTLNDQLGTFLEELKARPLGDIPPKFASVFQALLNVTSEESLRSALASLNADDQTSIIDKYNEELEGEEEWGWPSTLLLLSIAKKHLLPQEEVPRQKRIRTG